MSINSELSDTERKAYESYILSKTDQERQEAIKKLIPGSIPYYHLYFLDLINRNKGEFTQEEQQIFNDFEQKYNHTQEFTQIDERYLLTKIEHSTDDNTKANLIQKLQSKYLSVDFNHQKIIDHSKQNEDSQSSQEESDEDEEEKSKNSGGPRPNKQLAELLNYGNQVYGILKSSSHVKSAKQHNLNFQELFNRNIILEQINPAMPLSQQESINLLNKVPAGYEQDINFVNFNPTAVYQWARTIGTKVSDIMSDSFYQVLQSFLETVGSKQNIDQTLCNNLTLQQLDKLSQFHHKIKEDKNFIGSYFQKLFSEELSQENQEFWGIEEKRSNLQRLYQYAKGKDMPQSLQSYLLVEILELGIKLGIYDEHLFREFLKNPLINQFGFKSKRETNADQHWSQYIRNVQSAPQINGQFQQSQPELITKYLEYFCQQRGDLSAFKDDFEQLYLASIEEKISIYNSDDMTKLKIDLRKYQEVAQEVILRFLEQNKEIFRVDEEVSLQLELKNIPQLYIKIFEFNTETYYKKTLQPFNTGVNLDGLVASEEQTHEYKESPNRKFVRTYNFPQLNDKVGLFIVEFIGNGVSARAIIKKGQLSLIHQETVAGHLAYILDENKKVCKGDNTGLYFEGEYYPADPEDNGQIFIPYSKTNTKSSAILMNNGFAQLSNFESKTEQYVFDAVVFINSEDILIGNKATIFIKPSLKINNRVASLEMLKNTVITLTTINYTDNIPITKKFENINFTDSEELILDFQVPPFLQQINVDIDTQVKNVTQQQVQKFTKTISQQISTHQADTTNCELYLRKEGQDHCLYLLGKNGEPKRNVDISIRLVNMRYVQEIEPQALERNKVTLVTNRLGRVKLGFIKNDSIIIADVSQYNIRATYNIKSKNSFIQRPEQLNIIENQEIELPVDFKNLTRRKLQLIKKEQDNVLEDFYDKITFEKGQYWDNDSFILKKHCLLESRLKMKTIKIESVKIEEAKNDKNDIQIQLKDFSEDARVHVFTKTFEMENPQIFFQQLEKIMRDPFTSTTFPFANWKNILLSNRELGDEFRYVFDRKYAERLIGNSLERPSLLMKRSFIKQTETDSEMLKQGAEFQQQQVNEIQSQVIQQQVQPVANYAYDMNSNVQPSFSNSQPIMRQSAQPQAYFGNNNNYSHQRSGGSMQQVVGQLPNKFNEFQNFIKAAPLSWQNLKPDKNGVVNINGNLAPYTQLQVIAIDDESVTWSSISLKVNEIQKRDLSLLKSLDAEKAFTETRTTEILKKGQTYLVEDITSSQIQQIDDLQKVYSVLEEIQRASNVQSAKTKEFKFLLKWNTFTQEKKNKYFSKYVSHELNIFLYFKDKKYFQDIVKQYIEYKMEKTFIDYYLLEKYDYLIKNYFPDFLAFKSSTELNALELCFLIDALVKVDKKEKADSIYQYMKSYRDTNEDKSIYQFNKLFDIVLNLNSLQQQKDMIQPDSQYLDQEQSNYKRFQADAAEAVQFTSYSAVIPPTQGGGGLYGTQAHQQQMLQHQQVQQQMIQPRSFGNAQDFSSNQMMGASGMLSNQSAFKKSMPRQENLFAQKEKAYLADKRKQVKIQFKEIEKTNLYQETHYYVYNDSKNYFSALVPINSFWIDYAEFLLNKDNTQQNFLSGNFWRNSNAQAVDLLATLAIMNLPLETITHKYVSKERGLQILPAGDFILLKKEVREAELLNNNEILVTQRYYQQGHQEKESAIEEFLVNQVYICEIIITNASATSKEIAVLYEVPQGSLPLQAPKYLKTIQMSMPSYSTKKDQFYFYFPKDGNFTHAPINVAKDQKVIAKSSQNMLKVVRNYSELKKETFQDIANSAQKSEILEFMKTKNLLSKEQGYDTTYILWLLKDKEFFIQVTDILRDKFIYDKQVWSYSLLHRTDKRTLQEFFTNEVQHKTLNVGHFFESDLVNMKPLQKSFKINDFYPMINSRAHSLGEGTQSWTLNKTFKDTYKQFLIQLIEKRTLSVIEQLMLVYYLQLQERISESIALFNSIDLKKFQEEVTNDQTLQIQYDYMSAYFDFYTGASESYKTARKIVRQYEDYPVEYLRVLFLDILEQLNEIDGETDINLETNAKKIDTEEQKKQNYKKAVNKEPYLGSEVTSDNNGQVIIHTQNIKKAVLKFYIIDVEVLFSRTPFLKENTEEFSYVKPFFVIEKEIQSQNEYTLSQQQNIAIDIPEELKSKNMVIEINGGGKQMFKTYYSSQLKVTLIETYGELKVTDSKGKAQPKVYVKVFSQNKGESAGNATFFKDGYTDVRGKFEYAQTNSSKLEVVQKFAILVMSDEHGSVIKECNPPKSQGQKSGGVQMGQNQQKIERILKNKGQKSTFDLD